MYKTVINQFFLACLCFTTTVHAQSVDEEFNKFCNPPKDTTSVIVCTVARDLKSSPLKVGVAMTLAGLDMAGKFCNFNINQKHIDGRSMIFKDLEIKRLTNILTEKYRNKPLPGYYEDPKGFCEVQYKMFGPQSKEKIFK